MSYKSYVFIGVFFLLDRLLKQIALQGSDFFVSSLHMGFGLSTNRGIALGLSLPPIIVLPVIVLVLWVLFYTLKKNYRTWPPSLVFALSLVILGGVSNMIDRFLFGAVVDYLVIVTPWSRLTLNLADIMIVGGVGLFVLTDYGTSAKKPHTKSDTKKVNRQKDARAEKIIMQTENTYDTIAEQFSLSRDIPLFEEVVALKKYVHEGDALLDIGCGNGRLASLFDLDRIRYTGVDASTRLLEYARAKYTSRARFVQADMRSLDFDDNSFDCVFMIASLHHVPSLFHGRVLNQVYRVLKPGGYLCMTNFNLWRLSLKDKTVWRYRSAKDVETRWNGHPLYYYAFTLRELRSKCRHAGVRVKKAYYSEEGKHAHWWNGRNLVLVCKK